MSILTPGNPTLGRRAVNATQSAHPELWRGLVGAWVPALGFQGSRFVNLITDDDASLNGGTWQPSNIGTAVQFGASGTDVARADSVPRLSRTGGQASQTIMVRCLPTSTPDGVDCLFSVVDSNNSEGWGVQVSESSGNLALLLFTIGDNTGTHDTGASLLQPHVLSFVFDSADDLIELWRDGQNVYRDTAYTDDSAIDSPDLSIGNQIGGNDGSTLTRSFNGLISEYVAWDRALTDSEHIQLAYDPLAPFRLSDDTDLIAGAIGGREDDLFSGMMGAIA